MKTLLINVVLCIACSLAVRERRYAIEGSFWGVRTISFSISKPSRSMPFDQLLDVFQRAFAVWGEHSQLRFEYHPDSVANIDIQFVSGDHGDGEPFDGEGMILAHAYFPRYGGDLHFDDDEPWSSDKEKGLDLYGVAVHEIGHALGLKHSHVSASIMAPYYQTYTGTQLRLHKDDMLALERLYGENGVAIRRIDQPSICDNAALDAITRLQNGTIYAFQGNFVWVIEDMAASRKLVPIRISSLWPEIEGPLDAVLTLPNGSSYVFKSSKYWMLSQDGAVLPGYPREIRLGLVDMPLSVDAAFVYHGDDRTYFVRKDRYWKYSRYGMPQSWPRQLRTIFKGSAPQRIDAAFRFDGNSTFAFVGNKFWRLTGSDQIRAVDGPRSTAKYWFNCDNQISNKN